MMRQAHRHLGLLYLLATAIGWGFNWPALKVLLAEWPALFSRGVAGCTAALILAAIALARGERLAVPRAAMPRLVLASFTNVFAWMGFSTLALKTLTAGQGALLVYTMPIWTTLFAWPVLGSRPTARGVAALALGIAGVFALLGGGGVAASGGQWWGVALALAAAMSFALGTVLNRTPMPIPPLATVVWQVGLGCLPMILLGLAFERPAPALDPLGWAILAYMTLVPMALCYVTWFATLRHIPPATAATGMLLVPLIGVTSAAALLGEPFGLRQALAMALTFAGVALALRAPAPRKE